MEEPLATFTINSKGGIIRPYHSGDHPQTRTLWESTGQFDPDWDSETSLRLMIKQQPHALLVAELDGQIVGTVGLQSLGTRAELFRFNVHKNLRGRGLDRILLRMAESILKRQGIKKVRLSFLDGNSGLAQYYRRRGWTIQSDLRWVATKEL